MGLDFGAFGAAAANAASADLVNRQANALELKMRSRLIEQQQQGQLNSEKAMMDYGRFSPEESDQLGAMAGVKRTQPRGFTVPQAGLLGGMAQSKIKASGSSAGLQVKVIGDGPDQKVVWVNKNRPGEVAGELKVGQNPGMYKAYAKTAGEYAPVKVVVDNLNASVAGLLSDKNLLVRGVNSGKLKMGQLLKEGDERVIDLINNRKGYALQIAAVVNKGRPSDPDAKAIELMLPNENDSVSYAKTKMDRIESMLEATEESDYRMLMAGDLPEFRKDKNREAAGGVSPSDIKAERARRAALKQPKVQ